MIEAGIYAHLFCSDLQLPKLYELLVGEDEGVVKEADKVQCKEVQSGRKAVFELE